MTGAAGSGKLTCSTGADAGVEVGAGLDRLAGWPGGFSGPLGPHNGAHDVYAIISDGAHQYRVEEGQILQVERKPSLPEDAETVEFERVLFVGDLEDGPRVGQPVVEGATVSASVLGEIKGPKITIQKLRRRKGYRLKQGHRQRYLHVRIDKIET